MKNVNYRILSLLALLLLSAFSVMAQAAVKIDVELVSRASDGTLGDNTSSNSAISDDGRYVVFESYATNLVANDTNDKIDIFLLDRQATSDQIKRISVNTSGGDANNNSTKPVISGDGRYVVFQSNASDFDTLETVTDTDNDLFLYDVNQGTLKRITLDINGQEADNLSGTPSISRNGRYIAFESDATDLVANDTNGQRDIFLYDMTTETIELVSIPPQGVTFDGTYIASQLAVSDDGDVLFDAYPADDPDGNDHLYLRDRSAGTTTRIHSTPQGNYPNNYATVGSISADGAYIAFESNATDLINITENNNDEDVFLYEVATGTITLMSKSINGGTASLGSYSPLISADGRYVTFYSRATDLVSATVTNYNHVYIYDRVLDELNVVSLGAGGEFPTQYSRNDFISATGEFVLVSSAYAGFVDNDDNGRTDVFLFTLALETNVTVSDVTKAEGTGGTTDFTFTATSDNNVNGGFTVNFATSDGTAIAGEDYTALSGTLNFAGTKGETQSFTVSVAGDSTLESNETFTVTLSGPSKSNVIGNDTATGTITNDDSAVVTIEDVSISEGDSGTVNMTFTATVNKAVQGGFTVKFATSNGTATAGEDYTAKSGTLTFNGNAGEKKTFTISVKGDTKVESNETFTVTLSNPSKTAITASDTAKGTITNDDGAVVLVADVSQSEGSSGTSTMTFSATLQEAVDGSFTVKYATSNGTAIAGEDYTAKSGTLTFTGTANEVQTFTVSITGDTTVESDETFTVTLSNPSNSNVTASDTATGTITNDDFTIKVLTDGGFEGTEKFQGAPLAWSPKGTTVLGKDKQKCNKPLLNKYISHSGDCAFLFKGNPGGGKSKINQKIEDITVFTDGDVVTFSAYVDNRSAKVGHPIGKLIIAYSDGNKDKLLLTAPDADGYALVSDSVNIDLSGGRTVVLVKAQFRYKLTSGKFFIDDASLTVTPLMPLRTERELLPLPEVPDSFRD